LILHDQLVKAGSIGQRYTFHADHITLYSISSLASGECNSGHQHYSQHDSSHIAQFLFHHQLLVSPRQERWAMIPFESFQLPTTSYSASSMPSPLRPERRSMLRKLRRRSGD